MMTAEEQFAEWLRTGRPTAQMTDDEFAEWLSHLTGRPEVRRVALVGSRAFGGARRDSGWDVMAWLWDHCYTLDGAFPEPTAYREPDIVEQRIQAAVARFGLSLFFVRPHGVIKGWVWTDVVELLAWALVVQETRAALLGKDPALYQRREKVELYTGMRARELEALSEPEVWGRLIGACDAAEAADDHDLDSLREIIEGDLHGDWTALYNILPQAKVLYDAGAA